VYDEYQAQAFQLRYFDMDVKIAGGTGQGVTCPVYRGHERKKRPRSTYRVTLKPFNSIEDISNN
jgi:hypothetical protein